MFKNKVNEINEEKASKLLETGYKDAKEMLKDPDKVERFLQRLEKKLKNVPVAGEKLSSIPIMVSLIKSFINKDYTDVPIGTIIAVLSALMYFVSPIDLIPDSIPAIGYFDDAAVVSVCWKFVQSDIEEYVAWRNEHIKKI